MARDRTARQAAQLLRFQPEQDDVIRPLLRRHRGTTRTPSGIARPLGLTTVTSRASMPRREPAAQHRAAHIAGAIISSFTASGLALRLDQRGGQRLARGLAAPQDELEHRVEALALLDRRFDQQLGRTSDIVPSSSPSIIAACR